MHKMSDLAVDYALSKVIINQIACKMAVKPNEKGPKMKKSRLELRLPDDMKADLKRIAAKRGVTMTLLVEAALMELIASDAQASA